MTSGESTAGDRASASVFVAVDIEDAFEVFTAELNAWWRHGKKFRNAGARASEMHLEAKEGGRLFESFELPSGPRCIEVGKILEWDPPRFFALRWRNVNFKPHEETRVEVSFECKTGGTMVRVVHSGFASLPDDHPAKHGLAAADFCRSMGMWWGDQLRSLRELVAEANAKNNS